MGGGEIQNAQSNPGPPVGNVPQVANVNVGASGPKNPLPSSHLRYAGQACLPTTTRRHTCHEQRENRAAGSRSNTDDIVDKPHCKRTHEAFGRGWCCDLTCLGHGDPCIHLVLSNARQSGAKRRQLGVHHWSHVHAELIHNRVGDLHRRHVTDSWCQSQSRGRDVGVCGGYWSGHAAKVPRTLTSPCPPEPKAAQ